MQRLKTRSQFQAALSGGTVARTAHFALHRVALDAISREQQTQGVVAVALFAAQDVWLGAMVPKRWAKRAVTRNTIRRQIYSVSRTFELALPETAHVVRLRAGFNRAQFPSATSEALKSALRLELTQLFATAAPRCHVNSQACASP